MQDYLIICAGSTVKHYKEKIEKFLDKPIVMPEIIGVNNVFNLFGDLLDYSLWTNEKRFRNQYKWGQQAQLILSEKLYNSIVEVVPNYLEMNGIKDTIKDDIAKWRTAGCRAIQYAHDNGASNIYVVGMDGYTLKYKGDQHCYGSGNTDSDDMEYEAEKDEVIYNCLRNMRKNGVQFEILTPTVYKDFYNGGIL